MSAEYGRESESFEFESPMIFGSRPNQRNALPEAVDEEAAEATPSGPAAAVSAELAPAQRRWQRLRQMTLGGE